MNGLNFRRNSGQLVMYRFDEMAAQDGHFFSSSEVSSIAFH